MKSCLSCLHYTIFCEFGELGYQNYRELLGEKEDGGVGVVIEESNRMGEREKDGHSKN